MTRNTMSLEALRHFYKIATLPLGTPVWVRRSNTIYPQLARGKLAVFRGHAQPSHGGDRWTVALVSDGTTAVLQARHFYEAKP